MKNVTLEIMGPSQAEEKRCLSKISSSTTMLPGMCSLSRAEMLLSNIEWNIAVVFHRHFPNSASALWKSAKRKLNCCLCTSPLAVCSCVGNSCLNKTFSSLKKRINTSKHKVVKSWFLSGFVQSVLCHVLSYFFWLSCLFSPVRLQDSVLFCFIEDSLSVVVYFLF